MSVSWCGDAEEGQRSPGVAGQDLPARLGADDQQNLLHALAAVADPRDRPGVRYKLASLLAVAVCAVLAGATTFAAIADWAADLDPPARHRLGLPGQIPAGSTVRRFLVRVDAQVLQAVLAGWLRCRTTTRAARGRHHLRWGSLAARHRQHIPDLAFWSPSRKLVASINRWS